MQTEASIEIDRPVQEVFDYTTGNVAQWSPTVVENELLDEKREGTGTTFRCVTEDHGRRMEFEGTVTRCEPPVVHVSELKGKAFDIEAAYFFEDLSGRTRVTQRATVKAKGFFRVVFFLLGWLMRKGGCKAQERELMSLKNAMESSHPAPS